MELKREKVEQLKAVDKYLLSFPFRPEIYAELAERLPGFPLIIVNQENEILFGIDYYHYLKSQNVTETDVMCSEVNDKEALLLNFNLKEKLTGVNLYEKLVFVRKILPLAEKEEIYRKTGLDVTINPQLQENLDLLLTDEFKAVLTGEKVTLKAALALCSFSQQDRGTLLELFAAIPFTSSHQLKILEMSEEILFRDKQPLQEIFQRLDIEKSLEQERPQKAIIDTLFKHRNPVYAESEKQWLEEIEGMDLPGNMQVTHFPFFEKKQVRLTVLLDDVEELKKILKNI
jgi:hypothetical protein